MAYSYDLKTFKNLNSSFITIRQNYFDSWLVESGPPPLKLDDGNYIFFYNSARYVGPSPRPGYELEYNVGYVILAGNNPHQILERSD